MNDNEEFNCSFPNRWILDVERNVNGVLRGFSKIQKIKFTFNIKRGFLPITLI